MSTHAPALPAVDSFPDSRLSVAALECLQYASGIRLLLNIGTKWEQFAKSIGTEYVPIPQHNSEERGRQLIKEWLKGKSSEPATWKSLVETLMIISKETYSLANAISIFFGTPVDSSNSYMQILEVCHKQTEKIVGKCVYIHVQVCVCTTRCMRLVG